MLKALDYLQKQSQPIIHRDIKSKNILFIAGEVKLADFDLVAISNTKRKTLCGTPNYQAPEILLGNYYDEKIDVWALGVVMFELLTGFLPFTPNIPCKDKNEAKNLLEYNIVNSKIKFPHWVSSKAKNVIKKMMEKDPTKRWSPDRLLLMNFFSKRPKSSRKTKTYFFGQKEFPNKVDRKVIPLKPKIVTKEQLDDTLGEFRYKRIYNRKKEGKGNNRKFERVERRTKGRRIRDRTGKKLGKDFMMKVKTEEEKAAYEEYLKEKLLDPKILQKVPDLGVIFGLSRLLFL